MTTLHGKSFIGGNLAAGGQENKRATSPLDSSVLEPPFSSATLEDVDAALKLAEEAFAGLSARSGEERATFLERIADEIIALGDDLLNRAHLETGLPIARLTGERARTVGQLKLFAQVVREGSWVDARIDRPLPERQPLPRPDIRRMLVPLGPVVVFGSSNFPLAFSVAGGDTASALASGNPVVVKAHSGHPGTSELVATAVRRAVEACGLPAGAFSMLHGSGRIVGLALVRHPFTRAVGFTGSRTAGRALFEAAGTRPSPIPVFAEMSSLNPLFILPEALKEHGKAIAEGLKNSITLGVGQFCTKPGFVIAIEGPELAGFQEALRVAFEAVPPATMLHDAICNAFHAGATRASGVNGVQPLGKTTQTVEASKTHGGALMLRTTYQHFLQHPELADEVFGPFALLISVKSVAEMQSFARDLEGQLTATVHARAEDGEVARGLFSILQQKAGRLIVNGYPTGVEVCHAMNHGGPYPATTDSRFTSVGTAALYRFVRPMCYQGFPAQLLPQELRDENPLGIARLVDGVRTTATI